MGLDGPEPPQRRDNGLRAEQFVALADVDPRLGDHLLDLLKLADIPAYLEPSSDPLVATRYPVNGPIERLYVQADRRRAAREVVVAAAHEAGPEPPPPGRSGSPGDPPRTRPDLLSGLDTDAEFARMMARFDSPPPADPADPVGPAPTALDRIAINGDQDQDSDDADRLDATADAAARARDQDERRAEAAADDEDHFRPPAAPPFPVPRPATLGAFALFLLGLVVMARGDWFGLGAGTSFPLGVAAVLTAVVLLIRGLHDRPPEDSDPDDGAIV